MDNTLKRLLAAEQTARKITSAAKDEADAIVENAMREIKLEEDHFQARIPELRASFLDKAEQRAAQAVKELERRYDEHITMLRGAAEANEEQALDAAIEYLLYQGTRQDQ